MPDRPDSGQNQLGISSEVRSSREPGRRFEWCMMSPMRDSAPLRIVNSAAPIRICDNGGWTDTWFAGHGKVFNIAVSPCVEVQLKVHPIGVLPARVLLDVENFGDRYPFAPPALPGRHPLLEATIDEVGLPDTVSLEIGIFCEAPAGCSTGTSAAAAVALIGALGSLSSGRMTQRQVAATAHRIEVDRLGTQSGISGSNCARPTGGSTSSKCRPTPTRRCRNSRCRTPFGGSSNDALWFCFSAAHTCHRRCMTE